MLMIGMGVPMGMGVRDAIVRVPMRMHQIDSKEQIEICQDFA